MKLQDKYIVRWFEDGIYSLIDKTDNSVILQTTLEEINAYLDLVEKGLL